MKAIAFSPAAEADIDGIWDYSADRWGLDQADSYVDAIRDACYALAKGTKHGRPAEVLPDFLDIEALRRRSHAPPPRAP